MRFLREITRGIFRENPTFRLVLGLCPTLAVTTSVQNALGMGAAATFVLICSNAVISSLRRLIPDAVRIPCYIVVIAAFVTVVELLMKAYLPALHESLGIFIPLIVVNCIILGRAEAFASKNAVVWSIADGIGIGVGFTLALALIAFFREFLGNGSVTIWGSCALTNLHACKMTLFILPAGGFVMLGLTLALVNFLQARQAIRNGKMPAPPLDLDCRHCTLCSSGK